MEEFKGNFKEFHGYHVTQDGHFISPFIWRGKQNRMMTERKNRDGYLVVHLTVGEKCQKFYIHKVVALLYHGTKPHGRQICHGDGNKLNNHYLNLRYGTAKENADDRATHGKTAKGSKIGTSKLTEEQVLAIKNSPRGYGWGKRLAEKYNVSMAMISYIIHDKWWKSI